MAHAQQNQSESRHLNNRISRLPSPLPVLERLLTACHEEHGATEQIAHWCALDPALMGRLLALSATGNKPAPLRDPALMVNQLGIDGAKALAFTASLSMRNCAARSAEPPPLAKFWLRAITMALAARAIAQSMTDIPPHEAYAAGLLADLGRLLLDHQQPVSYTAMWEEPHDAKLPTTEWRAFGVSHAEISARMAERWQLESHITDALLYHHEPSHLLRESHPLVRVVNLADRFAEAICNDQHLPYGDATVTLCINEQTVDALGKRVRNRLAAIGKEMSIDLWSEEGFLPRRPPTLLEGDSLAEYAQENVLLLGIEQLFQSCYNDNELGQAVVHAGKLLFDLEPQLFVLNETNGELTPHANNGRLPIDATYQLQQSDSIVARSLRRNEIMSSIRDSEPPVIDRQLARYYDAAGLFCVPLTWQNRPFGVLVFGIDANLGHEMAHEHDLLRGFASRVASTLWRQQQRTEQHQQASSSADEQWRSRSREFRHEINNPLAIVKNYLHVLSSRLRDETDIPREVALIQDEIDRMAALVQQYTSGETNRHTAAVDVNKLLGDLLGIINHATSGDEPITIASDLDPAVPQIASDSGLLNQALLNLLKNATEAMPNGGTIRVTSQDRIYDSDAEWVEISIADSGPGLPDHVMRDLFQPVATTKGGNHSGIGLSITYKLIAELGGRISCASNARGTQFRILLPRSLITREGDQ